MSDVVDRLISASVGAAFLAAAGGPVGMGIAAVGEIVVVNKAIKDIKGIRKESRTDEPSVQDQDAIFKS